jgi:hypothetical protein
MSASESSVGVLLVESPADFAVLDLVRPMVAGVDVIVRQEPPGSTRDDLALMYGRRSVDPDADPVDREWAAMSAHRALRDGGAVVSLVARRSATAAGDFMDTYAELRAMRNQQLFWSNQIAGLRNAT